MKYIERYLKSHPGSFLATYYPTTEDKADALATGFVLVDSICIREADDDTADTPNGSLQVWRQGRASLSKMIAQLDRRVKYVMEW